MKNLIAELRRRHVIRTTTVYIGAAWVVIGAGDILFPMLDISEDVLRIVILAALAGIPVIALLSWMFELTPTGLSLDESLPPETPVQKRSPLDLILIAVLAGALAVSVVINFRQGSLFVTPNHIPLVAVIPFDDLSKNAGHVPHGLAEELLTLLVRAPNIRVMSQTTASAIGARGDMLEAARKLEADFMVRGSVRGEGNQFRLTIRLIDVASGEVVWANTFNGLLAEMFAAQEIVAANVADSLGVAIEFAHSSVQGLLSAEAVDLYLQASDAVRNSGSLDALHLARDRTASALELQHDFVAARALLCRVHMMTFARTEDAADFERGERSCREAMAQDPDSPHTRLAMSTLYNNAGRHDEAYEIASALIRQLPNWEEAHNQAGRSAWRKGDLEAAELAFRTGVALSPADYRPYLSLGNFYAQNQMYDKALAPFGKIVELLPDDFLGYASLGVTHYEMGNYDRAAALTRQALELDKNSRTYFNLGLIHNALAQPEAAANAFRESLNLNPKNYRALLFLSQSLEQSGDSSGAQAAGLEAIDVLEALVEVNPNDAYVISNAATVHAHYSSAETAVAWAERARTANSHDPKVQFNIGLTYYRIGQFERAVTEFIGALEMGYPEKLFINNELPADIRSHPKIQTRLAENKGGGIASGDQGL